MLSKFRFCGSQLSPLYKAQEHQRCCSCSFCNGSSRSGGNTPSAAVLKMGLLTYIAVAAGAGGTVVSAPIVLGAVGFTSAGIAAGSYAASMMSAAAVANGGGVAAGSLVAVLQSAGMAGLSTATTAAVASAGGTVGGLLAVLI
ncbi:hypothetical protein INR49_002961 [Caranx melampygus]|nr:hypothetical protein INR49_002961 [Caranx melampygus]